MVADLVHRERQEIREHDFHDRFEARNRKPDAGPHDPRFADWRRDHALCVLRREPLCNLERAAVRLVHVLAKQDDVGIFCEELIEGGVELSANVTLDPARRQRSGPRGSQYGYYRDQRACVGWRLGLRSHIGNEVPVPFLDLGADIVVERRPDPD
jgi:hypothetical protein